MHSCGYDARALDWSDIEPYWLVAEQDGRVVGATQVCYGKPIGRLDLTAVDPALPTGRRARVLRDLVLAAIAALKKHGAQAVDGFVPFKNKHIKRFYRKFGAYPKAQGNLIELPLTIPRAGRIMERRHG